MQITYQFAIDIFYVAAGALTGVVVGLTGVGGGALLTPVLVLIFEVNPITAVGTDLWFAVFTKLASLRANNSFKSVDWNIVRRLSLGSIPISILAVFLITYNKLQFESIWLKKLIGIMILMAALSIYYAKYFLKLAKYRRIASPETFRRWQGPLTIVSGAFLGLTVTLTSIGAGALGCTILWFLYPLRMTPNRLVTTDLAHAIPIATISGIGYLFLGAVEVNTLLNLLIGSIPGAMLARFVATKLTERTIQVALSIILIVAAVKMITS